MRPRAGLDAGGSGPEPHRERAPSAPAAPALPVARRTLLVCLRVAARLARPGGQSRSVSRPPVSQPRRPAPPRSLAHVDRGQSGRDHLRGCAGGERAACGGERAGQGSQLPFSRTLLTLGLVHWECEDITSPQRCGSRNAGGHTAGSAPPPEAALAAPRPRPPAPVLPSASSLCSAPDPAPPSGCPPAAARHLRGPSLHGPGPPPPPQDGEAGHGVLRGESDPEQR